MPGGAGRPAYLEELAGLACPGRLGSGISSPWAFAYREISRNRLAGPLFAIIPISEVKFRDFHQKRRGGSPRISKRGEGVGRESLVLESLGYE